MHKSNEYNWKVEENSLVFVDSFFYNDRIQRAVNSKKKFFLM